LQFVRYLPLVKARGGRVLFECPKPLLTLLAGVAGADQVVPAGSPSLPFDCHISLLSLPLIFGTDAGSIPAQVPYVKADPTLVDKWRSELAGVKGLKVGIAWQGSKQYRMDHFRSVPLQQFSVLGRVPGVSWISFQKGPGSEQITEVDFKVTDFGDRLDGAAGPFMDTAALMKVVDLVITTDTAIPHLAAALGVPTWVALPMVPDWRWLLDREDSPWYPTVRLFRQPVLGDWNRVFQRIAAALADQCSAGRRK
jgi:hypothetical protein